MTTKRLLHWLTGITWLLLPALAHGQREGAAFPRPNFKATTLTVTVTGGVTSHAASGRFREIGGRLDWSTSVGADPPATNSRALIVTGAAGKLLGREGREDGLALQGGLGFQLRDHQFAVTKPGIRLQSGVSYRRVPAIDDTIEQWDFPLGLGLNLQPPVSGVVAQLFASARAQVRHVGGSDAGTRAGAGFAAGIAPRVTTGPLHEFGFHAIVDGLWLAGQRRELAFGMGIFRIF
jgi:hypothetical protein